MKTKRMDVQMSELTMRQQRDIKDVDFVSLARTREIALADAIAKLHKKLLKPADILANLNGDSNE